MIHPVLASSRSLQNLLKMSSIERMARSQNLQMYLGCMARKSNWLSGKRCMIHVLHNHTDKMRLRAMDHIFTAHTQGRYTAFGCSEISNRHGKMHSCTCVHAAVFTSNIMSALTNGISNNMSEIPLKICWHDADCTCIADAYRTRCICCNFDSIVYAAANDSVEDVRATVQPLQVQLDHSKSSLTERNGHKVMGSDSLVTMRFYACVRACYDVSNSHAMAGPLTKILQRHVPLIQPGTCHTRCNATYATPASFMA